MKKRYNVAYTYNGKPRMYCVKSMDFKTALRMLELWVVKYWNTDAQSGKAYPSGKGFYPVTLAHIVEV